MKTNSNFMKIGVIYCVIVCGIANVLFFGAKYGFNLIMLSMAIKNIISSFTLTTGLSLSDLLNSGAMISAVEAYPAFVKSELFMNVLINAYAIATAIAPLCTASALILSARVFFRRLFSKKNVGNDTIVIFGYNNKVRSAVGKMSDITIISRKPIDAKEEFQLRKNNVHIQVFDVVNEDINATIDFLKKMEMEEVEKILIMDDSDAANFSIYQRLVAANLGLRSDCVIKSECSSQLIQQLFINSYQSQRALPIVLFTSNSLTANTILNQYPINEELNKDHNRILLIGFGETGQQVCQRITNEALENSDSYLYIDAIDRSIDKDRDQFLSKVSSKIGKTTKESYVLTNPDSDGTLEIKFHQYDIANPDFLDFLKKQEGYDYCAVITGNSDSALEAIIRIDNIIKEKKWTPFPIIACNDRSDEVIRYVNDDKTLYKNIHFVQKSGSIDAIFNETNEPDVIKFYDHYDDMNILGVTTEKEDNDEWLKVNDWNTLDFYTQAVVRKMYNHQLVKKTLLKEKYGDKLMSELAKRFGENGYLLKRVGNTFKYDCSSKEMLERVSEDELSLEMAKLEHRRWCVAMALDGWSYGEFYDEVNKTSPWLMDWESLSQKDPEACLFRLKPLLYMMIEK